MKTHAGDAVVLVSQANLLNDWSHVDNDEVTKTQLLVPLSNLHATLLATWAHNNPLLILTKSVQVYGAGGLIANEMHWLFLNWQYWFFVVIAKHVDLLTISVQVKTDFSAS